MDKHVLKSCIFPFISKYLHQILRMKPFAILVFVILVSSVYAQDPVSWSSEIVTSDSDTYVSIKAEVETGWYIYSMNTDEGGPIPTEVLFDSNEELKWTGELTEHGEVIKGYDEMFELNVAKYKEQVEYRQSFDGQIQKIVGEVTYMVCDSQRCLPPKTINIDILK